MTWGVPYVEKHPCHHYLQLPKLTAVLGEVHRSFGCGALYALSLGLPQGRLLAKGPQRWYGSLDMESCILFEANPVGGPLIRSVDLQQVVVTPVGGPW